MSHTQVHIDVQKVGTWNFRLSDNENKVKKEKSTIIFNLPDPVSSFGGRDNELSKLHQLLREHNIVVLTGMAGMGKSELAKKYASMYTEHYHFNIIWINADTNTNINDSFKKVANELNVKIEHRILSCVLQDIYGHFKTSIVLIILDNVIDQNSIWQYLPKRLQQDINIFIIITSQCRTWTDRVKLIELSPFTEEAAINLFAIVLEDKFDDCERGIWRDIARSLDFLPLFLQTSAAYILQETDGNNPSFTISEYLKRLQTEEHLLLDTPLADYNNKTIIASMQLTLEKITNTFSIQLIYVCSFLDPSYIDEKTILKVLDVVTMNDHLSQAIRVAKDLFLITYDGKQIRIHRLVQRILRQLQRKHDVASRYYEIALNMVVNNDDLFLHRRSVFRYAEEHFDIVYNMYKKKKSFNIIRLLTSYGCVKILEFIFSKMFKIRIKLMVKKRYLLYEAASSGNLETLQLIFKYCKNVNQMNKLGWTPLRASIEGGYEHITKFLVLNGASSNMKNEDKVTQLHEAAEIGNIEILRSLIDKAENVDVTDAEGYTPLIYALLGGHTEAIRLLIHKGAKVDILDRCIRTPLHYAAELMDADTVKLLLEQTDICLDVQDRNGWTPLHDSVIAGCTNIVKLLLNRGASINVKDYDGMTPLHWAVHRKQFEVLKLLLQNAKINIYERDDRGQTPLHCAVFVESIKIIDKLMEMDGNARDTDGRTALHYAVLGGNIFVAEHILDIDPAIVDQTDLEGRSPLHLAAEVGNTRIVRLLLSRGATINLKDIRGRTPLDVADIEFNENVICLLENLSSNHMFMS